MSARARNLLVGLVCLGATSLVTAGLVDFSDNLFNYVARRFSPDAPKRLTVWQRLIQDMRNAEAAGARRSEPKAESLTLRKMNDFFNQIPYYNDIVHWGKEDYWATPVEALSSFGADCEDYSIAKYLSLKELGIPIERLRITYVRAKDLGESHMVLAYYPTPEAEPLILDNLTRELKPASNVRIWNPFTVSTMTISGSPAGRPNEAALHRFACGGNSKKSWLENRRCKTRHHGARTS